MSNEPIHFLPADVPVLKSHWERFKAHIDLDVATAEKILSRFTNDRIDQISILSEGCANSNFKILFKSNHPPVILRVYMRDKSAIQREIHLHDYVHGKVPVARILYHDSSCEVIPYPFSILEWMTGILMREVILKRDEQAISECAFDAGEKLSVLRQIKFGKGGFFQDDFSIMPFNHDEDYLPYVNSLMCESIIEASLGIDLLKKVKTLIESNSQYIPDKDDANMTHGDYDPANILVNQVADKWKISAILDWEFALASTYLLDIGLFLRYSRRLPVSYELNFIRGFENNGLSLPHNWKKSARLMDLLCLLQLLYYNPLELRPNLNRDVVSLISEMIDHWQE